jgi:hypothetical protein
LLLDAVLQALVRHGEQFCQLFSKSFAHGVFWSMSLIGNPAAAALLYATAPTTASHLLLPAPQTWSSTFVLHPGIVSTVRYNNPNSLVSYLTEPYLATPSLLPHHNCLRLLSHVGVVSMGRFDDPNSGKSSFSFLLGAAPHLDMHYTIFG